MKVKYVIFLIFFLPKVLFAQTRILVKDNLSGKIRGLKQGKLVGLITISNDTIKYADKNTYPDNSYWYLKCFTDTSLTIEFKRTSETKSYDYKDIKSISFKRNESSGSPVALAAGGLALVIASPFIGINKGDYNFEQAGLAFGVGAGILTIVYLTTRNKNLINYSIVGPK